MVPIIIDVEASGFGRGSYPIEIGVALEDQKTHCYLVKPERDWRHWDSHAESLHGISRRLLEQKGHSVREVAENLNRLLESKTVYSDAWSYDSTWLAKLYEAAGLRQEFRIESLRYIMVDRQLAAWNHTHDHVVEELAVERHRASSDALIIQTIFERTANLRVE